MALRKSSTVTDSRSDQFDVALFKCYGLFADSVAARMSAVFWSMTSWYSSAVKHVSALGLFSPSNVFTSRQIRRELSAADLISIFQYDDAFFLASLRLERSDVLQAALDSAFLLVLNLRSSHLRSPTLLVEPRLTTRTWNSDTGANLSSSSLMTTLYRWNYTILIPEVC